MPRPTPMDTSLFNNLPAEIRNIIYAYSLFSPDGVTINSEPALLRTCKQIRSEATLMYWAINNFKISIHEERLNHKLCRWLQNAGSRLRLVQSLTVHIEMPSVGSKTEPPEDEAQEVCPVEFLHLMHIVVGGIVRRDRLQPVCGSIRDLETKISRTRFGWLIGAVRMSRT